MAPPWARPMIGAARRVVWRLSAPLVDERLAVQASHLGALEERLESSRRAVDTSVEGRLDELTAAVARLSHENEVLRKEILATNHRVSWFEEQADRAKA